VGYYAASRGNLLETFRDNISVPLEGTIKSEKTLEAVTDRLSGNVGKELPISVQKTLED
jgi:hypothetical protein